MQYNASALHAIAEVQKTNHWKATFSGTPFSSYADAIQMRLTSVTVPKPEISNLDVTTHGYSFSVPGIVKFKQDIEFNTFESVSGEIEEAMRSWYDKIYSRGTDDIEGKQGDTFDNLFGEVKLELLNAQESKTTRTYTCKKVLLKEYDPGGQLSDGANEADYFKPKFVLTINWYNQEKSSS